jgi:hypothetical protein
MAFIAAGACSPTPCTGANCSTTGGGSGGGGGSSTGGGASAGGSATGGGASAGGGSAAGGGSHTGGGAATGGGAGATGGGSGNPDGGLSQSTACADYLACAYATGAQAGSLDSTYGPAGTCWTNQTVADSCTSACTSALGELGSLFPDAGAVCQFDGGITQSAICASYLACAYATGAATSGSLDSSYGPSGTCWATQVAAQACTNACLTALDALQTAYPDAGAVCGQSESAICAEFLTCYAATIGDISSLVGTYGPGGTCWLNAATASACSDACESDLTSLQAAYPDAGTACHP